MLPLKSIYSINIYFKVQKLLFEHCSKVITINNILKGIIFLQKMSSLPFQTCPLEAYICITLKWALLFVPNCLKLA